MYPDDVAALFPLIPVGTPVRIINQPVKVAWVDGELLLEAHPPVDAEGQSFEPDVDEFASLLREAVGDSTVAIHWDYARDVLQKADGVLATVGLEADLSALNDPAQPESAPAPVPAEPGMKTPAASGGAPEAAAATGSTASGGPTTAPGASYEPAGSRAATAQTAAHIPTGNGGNQSP
jgi:L,D-transpeptidase ErfK/SrfK